MLLVYNQSSVMQIGIGGLISDFKFFEHNKPNTSLGYRIQFHNYAESLFLKHPIIGIGTGGFKYSFSQDQPIPAWGKELNDPHSQYWMTLSEQGLIGMLFFLSFLGSLFIASLQLTETRPILWGILAAFCIGSFSDTILCFSTAGYLLIVLSAICLGELLEKKESRLVRESANDSSMDQLAACK